MADRLDIEGDLVGERPDESTPVPNRADAAWAELQALRDEANTLGLEDYGAEPLAVLRSRVEQARNT